MDLHMILFEEEFVCASMAEGWVGWMGMCVCYM